MGSKGPGLGIYSRCGKKKLEIDKFSAANIFSTHLCTSLSVGIGEFERKSEKNWVESISFV